MKTFSLALVAILTCAHAATAETDTTKPNILFIFADDLGWKDVGYQGAELLETPRIDALTKSGMVLSNGYAPAGNCQPSRACLISGQYTPRHDVYAVASTDRGPKEHMRLVPVANKSGIPAKEFAMADALKSAGYATGIFGKWHLGGADGCNPKEQGFDVYYDSAKGGNPNASKGKTQEDPKGIFSMSEQAAKFMEENAKAKKPFFIFMSHHAIHTALEAKKETLAHFEAKVAAGAKGDPLYAACAKDLDSGVGLLLDKLEQLGIAENTIWKLHLYHEEWLLDGGREKLATNNSVELYHISEDIGEHNNLANTNTAKRDELLDELLAWCKSTNAKFPTPP